MAIPPNPVKSPMIAGAPVPAARRSALVGPTSAARWLLLFVIVAGIYFFYGFVVPVLAALVIGFATWPLYRRLLAAVKGHRTIAATIALLLVLFVIIVPLSLAIFNAVKEAKIWAGWVMAANNAGALPPPWLMQVPLVGDMLHEQWLHYLSKPGGFGELVQLVSGSNLANISHGVFIVGASAFQKLLSILFMLITLLFVYRDGERLVEQLDQLGEQILPGRWRRVSRIVPLTISSTVSGMTIIAIGEGIVLGVAYWLAGVPSPVTLGLITAVMALIPGGAPLAFTLISFYLVASGHFVAGVALFSWGTVELFIVDKTLRPKLVGGPIKLPFLPTFFGLIGGVKTMGFLGLFVGPVLMALLVSIWREWIYECRIANGACEPAPETDSAEETRQAQALENV